MNKKCWTMSIGTGLGEIGFDEGKIITDQDVYESKQFHDEQAANSNDKLRQDVKLLSDKLAKLNARVDMLIENLRSQVVISYKL